MSIDSDSIPITGIEPGIALLTLDHPPANALSTPVIVQFLERLAVLCVQEVPPAIVLSGAGHRFFCAGGDIREVNEITSDTAMVRIRKFHKLICAIEAYPGPFISAVTGYAVGGGLELLLFSDFVVANAEAQFGFPEINHGLLPIVKGIRQAAGIMGIKAARQLLYSGELIGAQRAHDLGVVDRIVPCDEVLPVAVALAKQFQQKDRRLLVSMKRALCISRSPSNHEMEIDTMDEVQAYVGRSESASARAGFLSRRRT